MEETFQQKLAKFMRGGPAPKKRCTKWHKYNWKIYVRLYDAGGDQIELDREKQHFQPKYNHFQPKYKYDAQ